MKTASVVSIGNELLSGQTVDTNLAYLGKSLAALGLGVVSSCTVGDDVQLIAEAIGQAAANADIILITGGLGPTDDDITRQGLAEFMGVELKFNAKLFDEIEQFFTERGYEMADKNKVQAYLPAGAIALKNKLGTAPGIMARYNGKLLFSMPGVPSEMKAMFTESIAPQLEGLGSDRIVVAGKLKCIGAGESTIAEMLGALMERGRNPLINCTVSSSIITLHIIATAADRDAGLSMIETDRRQLCEILGDLVFGTDDDTLAAVIGAELTRQGKTVATAESCTGGLISKMLTDTPGASQYFTHGWVTYNNDAKVSQLGVEQTLLDQYGAVSEPVAAAMAEGAREKSGADFAIAVTGIAGPDGGTEEKPVGSVYIAIAKDGHCDVQKRVFAHARGAMRLRTAITALNMLRHSMSS
ncbi:MAG TPA: competence/damage-inducible protein A [Phycisphaerales bacterium]|nr:competence/damage-inducible protein A [Phycisphaerales bacterium]